MIKKPFIGNYPITQKFGVKVNYMRAGTHNGVDFGLPKGTELRAVGDYEVIEAHPWQLTGYGRDIKIKLQDGTIAHYAHCSELFGKVGTKGKAGEVIAKSGNSGFCISLGGGGYHLHFGIMQNGKWIDPLSIMEEYALPIEKTAETKIEVKDENQEYTTYLTKKGDTLSAIARQFLGNGNKWKTIWEYNKDQIKNPHLIQVGMTIKIPK